MSVASGGVECRHEVASLEETKAKSRAWNGIPFFGTKMPLKTTWVI